MFNFILNVVNILTIDINRIKNNFIVKYIQNKYYTYNHSGYTEIDINSHMEEMKKYDKSMENSYLQIDKNFN